MFIALIPYVSKLNEMDFVFLNADGDIIWSVDLINTYKVFPHNLATSSPVIYKDNIYFVTSNGVDEGHKRIPSSRAPSFMCLDKNTGELM